MFSSGYNLQVAFDQVFFDNFLVDNQINGRFDAVNEQYLKERADRYRQEDMAHARNMRVLGFLLCTCVIFLIFHAMM